LSTYVSQCEDLAAQATHQGPQLEMLGYDMNWAAFYVVEVMSSPKFHIKSIGYLGAAQSFQQDTDVLMLTTNLLKKVNNLYFTLFY
jgi:AP-3 complex subunit delta